MKKKLLKLRARKALIGLAIFFALTTALQVQVAVTYAPILKVAVDFVQSLWVMTHGITLN